MSEASYFHCRLLWMVYGKCVLVLVDPFCSLDLMVNNTAILFIFSCLYVDVKFSIIWWRQLTLLSFIGELICPSYSELCNSDPVSVSGQCPNSCNFNGDCVDGRCHCFLGFHGHDCSKRELSFPTFMLYSLCVHCASAVSYLQQWRIHLFLF
jgi:hypothetical protein